MATESPQSPCNCCGDQVISLCGLPICASVNITWSDDLPDNEDIIGQDVEGLTCQSLRGGGISLQYSDGLWVGYAGTSQFSTQRSQDTDVTNPLNPTGTYYFLGGGSGDARPTLGTMTVTNVACPPA